MADFSGRVGLPVIASGGITRIDDLLALQSLGRAQLAGAIVGKALYEGRFRLDEAIARLVASETAC